MSHEQGVNRLRVRTGGADRACPALIGDTIAAHMPLPADPLAWMPLGSKRDRTTLKLYHMRMDLEQCCLSCSILPAIPKVLTTAAVKL